MNSFPNFEHRYESDMIMKTPFAQFILPNHNTKYLRSYHIDGHIGNTAAAATSPFFFNRQAELSN